MGECNDQNVRGLKIEIQIIYLRRQTMLAIYENLVASGLLARRPAATILLAVARILVYGSISVKAKDPDCWFF